MTDQSTSTLNALKDAFDELNFKHGKVFSASMHVALTILCFVDR